MRGDQQPNGFGVLVRAVAGTPHFDTQVLALHEAVLLEALDDPTSLPGDRLVSHSGEQEADAPRLSRLFGAPGLLLARAERHGSTEREHRVECVASLHATSARFCGCACTATRIPIPMVNGSSVRSLVRHECLDAQRALTWFSVKRPCDPHRPTFGVSNLILPPPIHQLVKISRKFALRERSNSWAALVAYSGRRRNFATASAPTCFPIAVPTSVELRKCTPS